MDNKCTPWITNMPGEVYHLKTNKQKNIQHIHTTCTKVIPNIQAGNSETETKYKSKALQFDDIDKV